MPRRAKLGPNGPKRILLFGPFFYPALIPASLDSKRILLFELRKRCAIRHDMVL